MIVVSDTSPVTTLMRIGKVNLLHTLYGKILLPEAVRDELLAAHPSLPEFFECERVKNRKSVNVLFAELDRGEAEAIALAKEKHALLLIDEIEGRDVAAREGIRFIGLLGVLAQAKLGGHIPSVGDVLKQIEGGTTFFISKEMKTLALKIAGEL